MRRSIVTLFLCAAVLAPAATIRATGAESLAEKLAERRVRTPSGASVAVLDERSSVLDPERLETCLVTIGESGAWPEAWLVVQDETVDWDLALHLRRTAEGAVEPGEAIGLPRSEWDPRSLKAALREALGHKPNAKVRNVVVHGFGKRIVTVYPYQVADVDRSRGLMALVPEGTILREARSVDVGDGVRRTLAIVVRDARFEPADCATARGEAYGHLDRGTILAVLAGPKAIDAEIDLTAALDLGGEGALPRYRCREGESPATLDSARVRDWIGARDPTSLLDWTDVDGDGRALEIRLPRVTPDGAFDEVVLAVGPDAAVLRVVEP